MKKTLIALSLLSSLGAWASEDSKWEWRIGATQITPHVSSGNEITSTGYEVPNTPTGITANTQPTGGLSYRFDEHWVADVPLGLGFNHTIYGQGALSKFNQLATVKALPITALMQYRFGSSSQNIRPYVGAGLTYAYFYGAQGSAQLDTSARQAVGTNLGLSVQSKWAPSVQVGVQFKLSESLRLDVNYIQTYLDTRTDISNGAHITSTINPGALSVSLVSSF